MDEDKYTKHCYIYKVYYGTEYCPLCNPDRITESEKARFNPLVIGKVEHKRGFLRTSDQQHYNTFRLMPRDYGYDDEREAGL